MKFPFDKTGAADSSFRNRRWILLAKIGAVTGIAGLGYLLFSGPVMQFLSSNTGSSGPVVTQGPEFSSSNGTSGFLGLPYEFWFAGIIGVLVWLLWQTTHGRGPLGKLNHKLREGGADWQEDDHYSPADNVQGRGKTPGFLQRQRGKLLAQGTIGLSIFFAFFLSIGSFLTTTEGMINFTTPEGNTEGALPFSVPISLTVSLGIQGVLFIISWVVAQDLAERSRKRAEATGHKPHLLVRMFLGLGGLIGLRPRSGRRGSADTPTSQVSEIPYVISDFGKVAMLLISMFASVFFSFDSLFDRVFKLAERKKIELSIARSETASSFSLIRNGLIESRSDKLEQLADSEGWSEYHRNVNAVLDLALNSQKILTDSIRQQQAELEADADKIKVELNENLAELEKYRTQINALKNGETITTGPDPEQLKLQLAPIKLRVDSLRVEIARLDVEMNIEAVEGRVGPDGKRRPAGKGPAYRALKKERGVAQSELTPLQKQQKKLGGATRKSSHQRGRPGKPA